MLRKMFKICVFYRKCVDLALEDVANFLHKEGGQVSVSISLLMSESR